MQFFHLFCLVALAAASPQLPTPVGPPPPLTPADGSTSTPVPVVPPPPPTKATTETPKPPAPTPDGPICECGYTYCGSVLMTMKKPWNQKQLGDAYCKTPNASCPNNKPSSDIFSAAATSASMSVPITELAVRRPVLLLLINSQWLEDKKILL
ncbi:hypothetical protein VHEMI03342 [[Torrubiella] hemipterigena]|uniref:Uncharacterized protein n=1 Tax=[Torrubiella] hemipterigena TaxID=1531966 RepID=A0A0A1SY75_9HYPO|nr:hypothetical protein VHEMI03342 [[Torrubiella] hemipterigena]